MKNAFIFHGTEGFPEENWFPWLKAELEKNGFSVEVPQFPSPPVIPSKLSEWLEVWDNYKDKVNEDTVLIGHSLGGVFALRLLEGFEKPISAAFFVGTPIGVQPVLNYERDKAFGGFNFDWGKIKNSAKRFAVYHSDNDPYVDLENGRQLAKKLGVVLTFIPNAGHFNAKAGYTNFPKLLEECLK